jgi:hypothetical protein
MTHKTPPRIRCRPIGEADIASVIDLLSKGFPRRTRAYWEHAMRQLARREAPAAYPRFGYVLEDNGDLVGVLLLIFSTLYARGEAYVRCNGSGWYIDPAYRGYASLLLSATLRYGGVTYTNLDPSKHTWPIIEAQGFTRYSSGQVLACPALNSRVANSCVHPFDIGHDYGPALREDERDILVAHAGYGCLAYVVAERGEASPFVFLPRRLRGFVPAAKLAYCRDVRDFVRFAGPIGRALMRRGIPFVCLDATGPLPGLIGKYFSNRAPNYFKGPERPRSGDLAYSEMVLFGP